MIGPVIQSSAAYHIKFLNFGIKHVVIFQVNGVRVTPGATFKGFKITKDGNYMVMIADFGLEAKFDGDKYVSVNVPKTYKSQLEGICGSCDGDPKNDFMTKDGKDVSSDKSKYTLIGNSYQVDDPSDPK